MASSHQKSDQYMMRFPEGMRARLKASAKANGRSMNEEILQALETAYPTPDPSTALNEARLLRMKAAAFSREADALLRALEDRARQNAEKRK